MIRTRFAALALAALVPAGLPLAAAQTSPAAPTAPVPQGSTNPPAAPAPKPAPTNTTPAPAASPAPDGPDTATPPAAGLTDDELLERAEGGAEVISVESKSEGQTLRESARAITVVETKVARKRAADLGEVLSRVQGVQVRRTGGLGSFARFSLNGLYDDQVRFFLNGVPLELAGWGIGIANVPIDLLQRVDIHRGVVPIALGADALGGAVDLITDQSWVSRAAASVEMGSFGTYRGSLTAVTRDADTGLALNFSAFADRSLNNYPIDVEVPDEQGRLQKVRVRRFHDGYLAAGGNAEIGIVDRGPLRRALVRVFSSQYDKDLQSNRVMTIPYGEAGYGESARGVTGEVLIEQGPWRLRAIGGATFRRIDFHDTTTKVYDWFGNAVRDRATPGEIESLAAYRLIPESSGFGRLIGERALGDHQRLRVAIAPTATYRHGDDLLSGPGERGPLDAKRNLVKLITGVEHEWRTDDDAIQNVGFVKHYAMWTDAEDVQPGDVFVPIKQNNRRFGVGDGIRWRALRWLSFKLSYEYATRLPSVDELFGDGRLIQPNLALEPEVSHNGNLEASFDYDGRYGQINAAADIYVRDTDKQIVPIGNDHNITNQNVYKARTLGIEGGGKWTVPGGWGWVDGSITVQDQRNVSSEGTFGSFKGDRILDRPWLLGSFGATFRLSDVLRAGDQFLAFGDSRYVHEFFRGWESLGTRDSKQIIPSQLVHSVGVTYLLHLDQSYSATLECQNLTDTLAYDSFGTVRPGRAYYLKLGVEL